MVLIGLLLVALVCIVIGVVFASGPWFIASLIASAVAGYFLYRQREQISGHGDSGAKGGTQSSTDAPPKRQTALVTGTAFQGVTSSDASPTAAPAPDGGSSPSPAGSSSAPANPSGAAVELAADTTVWVVDGEPQFHAEDCGRIAALSPEVIPYAQAVADGFTECSACGPVAAAKSPATNAPAPEATTGEAAAAEEPATELEQPATAEPVQSGAGDDGSAGDVWVVDGRPRFHLHDCLSIKDQPAEPIPMDQATEDGFIPCTMCEPNATRV